MAFATTDFTPAQADRRPGLFSRMFNAMVEARMRQAERLVATHLMALDDKTLNELGFDRAEVVRKSAGFRV